MENRSQQTELWTIYHDKILLKRVVNGYIVVVLVYSLLFDFLHFFSSVRYYFVTFRPYRCPHCSHTDVFTVGQ